MGTAGDQGQPSRVAAAARIFDAAEMTVLPFSNPVAPAAEADDEEALLAELDEVQVAQFLTTTLRLDPPIARGAWDLFRDAAGLRAIHWELAPGLFEPLGGRLMIIVGPDMWEPLPDAISEVMISADEGASQVLREAIAVARLALDTWPEARYLVDADGVSPAVIQALRASHPERASRIDAAGRTLALGLE